MKDEKYKQDNLHGGLWTRSVEESYAKGQNEFKKDMVVAEAVLTVYSGGMGTAALKGGKSVAKLDVDAPHGSKKPHANGDSDGGKGRGGPLHGSGKNGPAGRHAPQGQKAQDEGRAIRWNFSLIKS